MKKLLMTRRFALGLTMAAAAALISGCATCKPGSTPKLEYFPITVILDDSLKDSSMQVDLVGVNGASLPRLNGYSMTQYWKDGDATRKDADKVTFSFLDGKIGPFTIDDSETKDHEVIRGSKAIVLPDEHRG